MRLFGKVNSATDRFDRAVWVTGGPWGGFDLALAAAPVAAELSLGKFLIAPQFSRLTFTVQPQFSQTLLIDRP